MAGGILAKDIGNDVRSVLCDEQGRLLILNNELSKFASSDVDNFSLSATTQFFGFVDKDENWYILRREYTNNRKVIENRYFKGEGSYEAAFTGRAGHAYDHYFDIF